jgi:hypothetical protein
MSSTLRYTRDELSGLDAAAASLGIELVPAIQLLGHLEQMLHWPAYANLRDTPSVMLAEEEATYEMVEAMLRAATVAMRSRRVHIGRV